MQADQTSTEAMVEFIRTQLDADERNARIMDDRQLDSGWEIDSSFPPGHTIVPHVGRIHEIEAAEHIVRFGPDRVLAQVAAHRAILDLFDPPDREAHPGEPCTNDIEADPGGEYYSEYDSCDRHLREVDRRRAEGRFSSVTVLRHLAAMYAGREGWREEWRPV